MTGHRRLGLALCALLLAGCSDGRTSEPRSFPAESVSRVRSPMVLAGCFDLHVGRWNRPDEPGRRNFRLPPTVMLRFNYRTDSIRNDTYRLEPSIRRGRTLHTGRWVFQMGQADSVKMLWSDGEEGVLILSEPLSAESMTGIAVATFQGEADPTSRAPISMLRRPCEMGGGR